MSRGLTADEARALLDNFDRYVAHAFRCIDVLQSAGEDAVRRAAADSDWQLGRHAGYMRCATELRAALRAPAPIVPPVSECCGEKAAGRYCAKCGYECRLTDVLQFTPEELLHVAANTLLPKDQGKRSAVVTLVHMLERADT